MPSIQNANNEIQSKLAITKKKGTDLEEVIDKYCRTKVNGSESKTFRDHAKRLLE